MKRATVWVSPSGFEFSVLELPNTGNLSSDIQPFQNSPNRKSELRIELEELFVPLIENSIWVLNVLSHNFQHPLKKLEL